MAYRQNEDFGSPCCLALASLPKQTIVTFELQCVLTGICRVVQVLFVTTDNHTTDTAQAQT